MRRGNMEGYDYNFYQFLNSKILSEIDFIYKKKGFKLKNFLMRFFWS